MLSDVTRDEVEGRIILKRTDKSRYSYIPKPIRFVNPEYKPDSLAKPQYPSQQRRLASSSNQRVSDSSPSEHVPGTLLGDKVFHSSLDVSHIRSRIFSFDNILYQPQASNVKIFHNKPSYSHVQTKIPSPITPAVKPEKLNTVSNQKADYSHVSPLVSYHDNEMYTPRGGNVTIKTQKLNFRETAKYRIDTQSNHKARISDVSIPSYKVNFRELATARIDSRRDLELKETPKSTRHLIELLTVSLPDLRKDREPDHLHILSTTPPQGFSIESQKQRPFDNEA